MPHKWRSCSACRFVVLVVAVLFAMACSVAPSPAVAPSAGWNPSTAEWVDTPLGHALRATSLANGPSVVTRVNPHYPDVDMKSHTSGEVQMDVLINTHGQVMDCNVLTAPSGTLGDAAKQAVLQWVFAPTEVDGKAVPVLASVTIAFTRP